MDVQPDWNVIMRFVYGILLALISIVTAFVGKILRWSMEQNFKSIKNDICSVKEEVGKVNGKLDRHVELHVTGKV